MSDSCQGVPDDPWEDIGMAGCIPPPPRKNTKIRVLQQMMDVNSEKVKVLSKEEDLQAEKKAALDEKMKVLSKEEDLQVEKKAALDEKMDILSKMWDAVSRRGWTSPEPVNAYR